MNTDSLQRVTFVLDRVTAEQLSAIAQRLGVSRSSLAREVMAEPVELMHRWIASMPAEPTKADAEAMLERMAVDVEGWLDSKTAQFDLLRGPTDGTA